MTRNPCFAIAASVPSGQWPRVRLRRPERVRTLTLAVTVPAGGAEHMATLVGQLREGHRNTIFVAAGDLIGASPFLSAMFHDEPTIEALSMMGLNISSVGNHEFDEGKDELLRMQNGGCHPVDQCQGPHPFAGAKFRYLAASTFEKGSGKTVFPPYEIRAFDGIPVARKEDDGHFMPEITDFRVVEKFDAKLFEQP